MDTPGSESFVLRGGSYKFAGTTLCVLLALVMLAPALVSGSLGGHLIGFVGVGVFVFAGTRWTRARVAIGPMQLQLRTPFRTHQLAWDQVRRAKIVSANNSNRLVSVVKVWTVDGQTIKVDGVGSWGRAAKATSVWQAVELINRYARGADDQAPT